jgi:hypothetical protein
MKKNIVCAVIVSLLINLAAIGQVAKLTGTSKSTFKIGAAGATPLTLTNTSGTLSMTSGLTVSGGTINFNGATVSNGGAVTTIDINGGTIDGTAIGGSSASTGAFSTISATGAITSTLSTGTAPFTITSTTKCTNLNVDTTDGISLVAGSNGGVVYQSSSTGFTATSAGTAGQIVLSGGSGAPTFLGLTSANIIVGNSSNIPAAVAMSGDLTITNGGVTAIGASKVTAAMLADAVADEVVKATFTAGAEASNVIRVTFQCKDAQANNVTGVKAVMWNLSDSASSASETAQSPTVAYVTGAAWNTITADKKAIAFTDSNGALTLDVTLVGDLTIHGVCAIGGKVYDVTMDYN